MKKQWQAAWLLRAVSVIDLTTLAGDDTPGNVQRLCAKARQPVRDDLLQALGMAGKGLHVGAVCVYHARVRVRTERSSGVPGLRAGEAACAAVPRAPSAVVIRRLLRGE